MNLTFHMVLKCIKKTDYVYKDKEVSFSMFDKDEKKRYKMVYLVCWYLNGT